MSIIAGDGVMVSKIDGDGVLISLNAPSQIKVDGIITTNGSQRIWGELGEGTSGAAALLEGFPLVQAGWKKLPMRTG